MRDPHDEPATLEVLLRLKHKHLMPCAAHFYQRPPVFVAAENCELIDREGRRYLDLFSGVAVVNAGHCNPEINAAIARQMQRLDHTTSIHLSEPILRLAEKLARIAPAGLTRSFFCVSGSEANEGALLLAAMHTGRSEFLSLSNSLHGRTKLAMGVTGLPFWRCDAAPPTNCHFVDIGDSTRAVESLVSTLAEIQPQRVAAIIAEPIRGNGGIETPPPGFWPIVREICNQAGILLIFDEVQTGMNRTGTWWAADGFTTSPDILTSAKALGNGYPIAAILTGDSVAASFVRPYASTFGGNPVGAAAALATIAFHERMELGQCARQRGEQLFAGLARLVERCGFLRRVRGKGLMVGVDVVDEAGNPAAQRCDAILEVAKDRGVLFGKTGPSRNVLTFMPPLTISPEQVDCCVAALGEVCSECD